MLMQPTWNVPEAFVPVALVYHIYNQHIHRNFVKPHLRPLSSSTCPSQASRGDSDQTRQHVLSGVPRIASGLLPTRAR